MAQNVVPIELIREGLAEVIYSGSGELDEFSRLYQMCDAATQVVYHLLDGDVSLADALVRVAREEQEDRGALESALNGDGSDDELVELLGALALVERAQRARARRSAETLTWDLGQVA